MAIRTRSEFASQVTSLAADNTSGDISAADIRSLLGDLEDSALFREDTNYLELTSADLSIDGTNGTSNRTTLGNAIDALVTAGGGILQLPQGEIALDGDIQIDNLQAFTDDTTRKPVWVRGHAAAEGIFTSFSNRAAGAHGTFIHPQTDEVLFKIRSPKTRVSGIVFDGNDVAEASRTNMVAILVGDGAGYVSPDNSSVSQGPEHQDCLKVQIFDCEFRRFGLAAIEYRDGQNLQVSNCRFYDNEGIGIFCPGGYFDNNHGMYIGNFFSFNGRGIYGSERPYQEFTVASTVDNTFTATGHNYTTDGRTFDVRTTGTLPNPLTVDTEYYVIRVDDNTFKLATSSANAAAGTAVDITDSGTGVHEIRYNHYTSNTNTFTGQNKFFNNGLDDLTFTANASTDELTWAGNKDRFYDGDGPIRLTTSGTLPAGLSTGTDYWTIYAGDNKVKLASSKENALAHTNIDITDTGLGTHSMDSFNAAVEHWGDTWGSGDTLFLEGNGVPYIMRSQAQSTMMSFIGDNSNPSPDNFFIGDLTTSSVIGRRPGFGKLHTYVRSWNIEATGKGTNAGGGSMSHTGNYEVSFLPTRASSGTHKWKFSSGPMDVSEVYLGDNSEGIRNFIGMTDTEIVPAATVGTVNANSTKSIVLTVPWASREVLLEAYQTNGNRKLDSGLIIESVTATNTTPAVDSTVTVVLRNVTGTNITQALDWYVRIMGIDPTR